MVVDCAVSCCDTVSGLFSITTTSHTTNMGSNLVPERRNGDGAPYQQDRCRRCRRRRSSCSTAARIGRQRADLRRDATGTGRECDAVPVIRHTQVLPVVSTGTESGTIDVEIITRLETFTVVADRTIPRDGITWCGRWCRRR